MPSNSKREVEEPLSFHLVIEEADGAFVCNCQDYGRNGKPCLGILIVRMRRDYGSVENYIGRPTTTILLHAP
jgi:hypothetical protein